MSRGAARLEGILPLDKPVGPTSHDMVQRMRRALGLKRIGHTGTLDPFASGLLLMCLGRATRLAEYLAVFPKEYLATARLGVATTTDDVEGEVTSSSEAWARLTSERVADALSELLGESLQRPPAYSAKKIRGENAYSRARRGEEVELEPVPITVHEIELVRLGLPEAEFRVRCSTGTYVRAIARDLGVELGVGAHLTALRRNAIGPFRVDRALALEDLENPAAIEAALVSPLEAVSHLPVVAVSEADANRVQSGQALTLAPDVRAGDSDALAVAYGSRLLAVAVREGDRLRPRKVFPLD